MVNANELKLNNWIKYADHKFWRKDVVGKLVQVDIDIFTEAERHPEWFDYCPLTSELLEQCGFTKGKYGEREQWLGPKITLVQPYNNSQLGVMKDMFGYVYEGETFHVRLDHLHTLQNLHQIITGTELNINL